MVLPKKERAPRVKSTINLSFAILTFQPLFYIDPKGAPQLGFRRPRGKPRGYSHRTAPRLFAASPEDPWWGLGWGDGEGDDGDGAGLGWEEGVEGFGEGGAGGEDVVDEGDVAAGDGRFGVEGEGVAEVGGAAGGCLAGLGCVWAGGTQGVGAQGDGEVAGDGLGDDLGLVVAAAEAFEPVHRYGDEEVDVGEDVGGLEVEGELRGEEGDELWGVVVFAVAD